MKLFYRGRKFLVNKSLFDSESFLMLIFVFNLFYR